MKPIVLLLVQIPPFSLSVELHIHTSPKDRVMHKDNIFDVFLYTFDYSAESMEVFYFGKWVTRPDDDYLIVCTLLCELQIAGRKSNCEKGISSFWFCNYRYEISQLVSDDMKLTCVCCRGNIVGEIRLTA